MTSSRHISTESDLLDVINAANSPCYGHELAAMRYQIRNCEIWVDWLAVVSSAAIQLEQDDA